MNNEYHQSDYCPIDGMILGKTRWSGMVKDHNRLMCAEGHLWFWCPGDKQAAAHRYCQPTLVREY